MDTNKWIFADKQHGFYYYFLDNDLYKKNSRVFSNRFKSGINVPQIENSTGLYDVLYIKTTRWKEISEFKDWISSNKTSLEYILNSPIKNDIQLPNINSIEGVNVININTNINPSSIEINS